MNYDRIILDLINRVSALEDNMRNLKTRNANKSSETESTFRDTTKYILDGKRYGKNRLVLSIIRKYMTISSNVSAEELTQVFDKSLQGSLGVVRDRKSTRLNSSHL